MCNKYLFPIFLIMCLWVMFACKLNPIGTENKPSVVISDGYITISDDFHQVLNAQVTIDDRINISKEISSNQKTSLLSLLKTNKDFFNDIAFLLAQENGDIPLRLMIGEYIDTAFVFHLDTKEVSLYFAKSIQGRCANLVGCHDASNVESDIIKWLFRNNIKNPSDDIINKMRLYLQELNRTNYNEYITNETIPVITSFQDINYRLTSNIIADNYYLFACKSEKEIEVFVEDMVSNKFEGSIHSLKQNISCFRSPSTSGTVCIFLVGIDENWDYKIAPVGLVCIDNVKPSITPINESGCSDIVLNKNRIKIKMPSKVPTVNGYAHLSTRDFGGNGIKCKVNFSLSFGGDIKSITLIREGALTYKNSLFTDVDNERKVIDLQSEKSPLLFSYDLHLEEGDNYLPVIISDLRGNSTEFKFNIPAHFTRPKEPSINIENDVNVDIYN